jgi:hypothetical protein
MRKYLLAACLACLIGAPTLAPAGSFNDQGQFGGTVSPAVTALLTQIPAGPALRAAIARLLETDPGLADDVVFAARQANRAQKEAMGAGVADAANYFAKCGSDACRDTEGRIRTAMLFADDGTRVGFVLSSAQTLAAGIPGFSNAGAHSDGCVTDHRRSRHRPRDCD